MTILICTYPFAPQIGGQETVVMSLARGLAEQSRDASGEAVVPPNVVVATPTPRKGFDDRALPFRVVRQPSVVQMMELVKAADVVHLAGPTLLPLILALLMGKRAIVEHHGFQTICPNGQFVYNPDQSLCPGHFMARRYGRCYRCNSHEGSTASLKQLLLTFPRRWLSQRMTANVAPTRWLDSLLALRRTTIIHHGVLPLGDPAAARPAARPAMPVTDPATPVITFQGRLVSSKGVAVLLRAVSLLKEKGLRFETRIIGDGPQRKELETLAESLRLGPSVRFLGSLPQQEFESQISLSAVVVMPSSAGEVFGLVALENMTRGRVVIVSELGALSEVVGDAGLTFPIGDSAALARRLEQVLTDPALASRYRERARQRSAVAFSHPDMIRRHLALYAESSRGPIASSVHGAE